MEERHFNMCRRVFISLTVCAKITKWHPCMSLCVCVCVCVCVCEYVCVCVCILVKSNSNQPTENCLKWIYENN